LISRSLTATGYVLATRKITAGPKYLPSETLSRPVFAFMQADLFSCPGRSQGNPEDSKTEVRLLMTSLLSEVYRCKSGNYCKSLAIRAWVAQPAPSMPHGLGARCLSPLAYSPGHSRADRFVHWHTSLRAQRHSECLTNRLFGPTPSSTPWPAEFPVQ
jgi:hypothetical protein